MKPVVRLFLAVAGLVALGASPQPRSAHASDMRPPRPSLLDRTRYDRFAPNPIRRARLAFLTPKRLSAERTTVGARGARGAATSSYKVLNLNALINRPHVTIDPLGLNNAGQIVGDSTAGDHNGNYFGYIIDASGANGALPSFGSSPSIQAIDYPTAISNNGRTVVGFENGYVEISPVDSYTYTDPILWTLTAPIIVPILDYGMDAPLFTSTSNQITVGQTFYVDNTTLKETNFPISNCPSTDFYARAVNDSGVIVGGSRSGTTVLTLGGCPTYVPNVGPNSGGDAIATNGDMIVLGAIYGGVDDVFLWAKGRVYPIPLPSGFDASKYYVDAIGLNASDVVVGNVEAKDGTGPVGAFVYRNGKSSDLQALFPPASGWVPAFVTGINDSGEIIGQGYLNKVLTPFALRK